jgi:lysozyme
MIQPRVIDLSHYDTVVERVLPAPASGYKPLADMKAAGVWGVIHKATQGVDIDDHTYIFRRTMALNAGLLWGAYHFNTGAAISAQVDHFLRAAKPDDNTLMALDFEDCTASEMSLDAAMEFLGALESRIGRDVVLYSGNRLKELLPSASDAVKAYICSRRLWLAEYGDVPHLPEGFEKSFLWQYTGDGEGPLPHNVPGVHGNGGVDLSAFDGSEDDLHAQWAGGSLT